MPTTPHRNPHHLSPRLGGWLAERGRCPVDHAAIITYGEEPTLMRHRGTRTAALAAISAALIAVGCSNSAAQPTPTPSTTTAATTTAATPSDLAIDQAKNEITAYYKIYNQVTENPAADPAAINTVAAGQEVANVASEVQGNKAKGRRAVGDTTITSMKPTGVNITKADADVTVDVCYDVSKVQGVDAQGAPLPRQTMQMVDSNNQIVAVPWRDQRLGHFTVHNSTWPDPSGWRVTNTDRKNEPC